MSENIPDIMDIIAAPVRLLTGIRNLFQVRGSEELAYWARLFEKFNYSPQEFYRMVEKNLEDRRVPGAGSSWLLLREGGVMSPERIYLNIKRERLLFLLCAAPFGGGFFVSSRYIDYRCGANWLDYLVGCAVLFGTGFGVMTEYGPIPGLFTLGLLITLFWSFMRRAVEVGAEWLDEQIAAIPVIGRIYESLFRPDTYYRRDTAEMFRQAVHNAVMQAVDEMTNQKGLRALNADERKPVLRNLYRR